MSDLRCAVCGNPLGHIDEACPRCLPGFYTATPAPKDAPVEPDGVAMLRDFLQERVGGMPFSLELNRVAKAMQYAFAAGRHATPQPEGEEITAMLADLRARGLHDAAEMLAVTEYGYRKLCEANDTLGKLVPQQTLRIAALEAAFRDLLDNLSDDSVGWCDRGIIARKNARDLLTPTSGAASGKGQGG